MSRRIRTYPGDTYLDPLNPVIDDIDIWDIAHSLAMTCRFRGHIRDFYSVAQHSVLVSLAVPPEDAMWGLLHDAPEAYLTDMPSPVKHSGLFGWLYRRHERKLMNAVCVRFGLDREEPVSVKKADQLMLLREESDLKYRTPGLRPVIRAHSPETAEKCFIHRYLELGGTLGT